MARIVQASVGPGKEQCSAYARSMRNLATFRYAQEFHLTAKKTGSSIVRAYLLGHAIELYLKAYLFQAGFSAKSLASKTYGHKLDVLLSEAKAQGIEKLVRISPQLSEDLLKLNTLYPSTLRYFSLLHFLTQPTIPPLARLFRFATSLSTKLENHVAVKT